MIGVWLGRRIRELWSMPFALFGAVLIAAVVAVGVPFGLHLFPPSIDRSSLELGSASTQVLVDTPRSTVTDLREDTADLRALSNRAVLVGTLMASPQVREFIAESSGVPVERILATAPLTPDEPETQAAAGDESGANAFDLLDAPDEYRLQISAEPTVPILELHAQGPSPEAARGLVDAAVDGLRAYLDAVAEERGTPEQSRVEIEQLGRPEAGLDGRGIAPERPAAGSGAGPG